MEANAKVLPVYLVVYQRLLCPLGVEIGLIHSIPLTDHRFLSLLSIVKPL